MSNNSSNSGIGVFGLLGVAFVVLKLTEFIDWSWWWVTAPFWMPLTLLLIGLGIYLLYELLKERKGTPKMKTPPPPYSGENKFQKKISQMMEEAAKKKNV